MIVFVIIIVFVLVIIIIIIKIVFSIMINIVFTSESSSHCCGQRLNIHIGSHREINLSEKALVLSQHFKVMSLHCNTDCDSISLSEYFRYFSPHFEATLVILVASQ